jgi:outer membrane protein OmpA-like peptidoglycan-associated protein
MLLAIGLLVLNTGAQQPGTAGATIVVGAAGNPLVVRDESGQVRGGIERAFTGELGVQVGLGWNLEALASVQGESRTATMMTDLQNGDGRLGARLTLGPVAVRALMGPVSGEGDADVTARKALGERLIVGVTGGYRARDRAEIYDAVWDDAVTWGGAAEVAVLAGAWAVAEVRGEVGLEDAASPAEWLVGMRWGIGDFGVGVFGGTGLGDAPGSPSWRVQVGATFAQRKTKAPPRTTVVAEYRAPHSFEEDLPGLPDVAERDPDSAGLDLIDVETPNVRVVNSEILLDEAVFFVTNRKRVRTQFRPILDELAVFLERHPEIARVQVEGHADITGPAEWNEKLSFLRSQEVCRYLVGRGVAADRLEPVPYGAARPWDDNATHAGRARNRRVVFTVTEVSR